MPIVQFVQANIDSILNDMDAGLTTSVNVQKDTDGSTVAKLVKWATFTAADVVAARDLEYISQQEAMAGPMSGVATNGLYRLVKVNADAVATPDNTVHSYYLYTNGAGSILFTSVPGGTVGNSTTVALVVAGLNTPLTVGVVGTDITINVATDGAGAATSTMAQVAAAVAASAAASALVTAIAGGTTSTVVAALGVTNLAGAAVQPAGMQKFQAYAIYRGRAESHRTGVAPSLTPRAVLISKTHADYLGL